MLELKRDELGAVVVDNGRPVYVRGDGSEVAVDVAALLAERDELDRAGAARDAQLQESLVRAAFAGSGFLREQTVLPPEIAYSHFGRNFEVQEVNGELQVKGRGADGKALGGSVDEALRALVEQSPHRELLLKAGPAGGGRAPGGGHGDAGSSKLWQEMSTRERAAYVERHGTEKATAKFESDRRR